MPVLMKKLSGSTDGRRILVAATASAGTTIHTAVASTNANTWDRIYLNATNSSTLAVKLTIEFGGTTSPNDTIEVTIPPESGQVPLIAGDILQNGTIVRAFAATGSVLTIGGHVFAVTP